jgi:hypothetical protein
MKSTLKTTAAVLRDIIGISVGEWEKIIGRTEHTIHALESGRLTLSPSLAAKMNYETGISMKWLLDGKPKAPPVSAGGRKYTKAIFDEAQARQKYFATVKDEDVRSTVVDALRVICAVLVNANRKRNFHLAVYRTAKALAELRDEFGEAKDFDRYDTAISYVLPPSMTPLSEDLRKSLRKVEQFFRHDYPAAFKTEWQRPLKKHRRR